MILLPKVVTRARAFFRAAVGPRKRLSFLLAVALLSVAVQGGTLLHANQVDLSVSPSLVEVSATSNGEATQDITVYNDGSDALGIEVSVTQYKRASGDYSAVEWLAVEPSRFELLPSTNSTVTVTIKTPVGLKSGGRYAMVVFRAAGPTAAGSAVGVAGELGVPFLITVDGEGPLVSQVKMGGIFPLLDTSGRIGAVAVGTNLGNIHLFCSGHVGVTDSSGTAVGDLEFTENTALLPGMTSMLFTGEDLPLTEGSSYLLKGFVDHHNTSHNASMEELNASFVVKPALRWDKLEMSIVSNRLLVTTDVFNPSDMAIFAQLRFAVADADGNILAASEAMPQTLILPGTSLNTSYPVAWQIPRGSYTGIAIAAYGGGLEVRQTVPFDVKAGMIPTVNAGWGTVPVREKAGIPAGWWIGGGIAAAVIAAGGLTIWFMSRHKGGTPPAPASQTPAAQE